MHMTSLDWTVVACVLGMFIAVAWVANRMTKSVADDLLTHDQPVAGWQRLFGITRMFTREDRITAYVLMGYFMLSALVFVGGTIYGYLAHPSEDAWLRFWGIYLITQVLLLVASTLWLGIGGIRDALRLFAGLRREKVNDNDTGEIIHDGH